MQLTVVLKFFISVESCAHWEQVFETVSLRSGDICLNSPALSPWVSYMHRCLSAFTSPSMHLCSIKHGSVFFRFPSVGYVFPTFCLFCFSNIINVSLCQIFCENLRYIQFANPYKIHEPVLIWAAPLWGHYKHRPSNISSLMPACHRQLGPPSFSSGPLSVHNRHFLLSKKKEAYIRKLPAIPSMGLWEFPLAHLDDRYPLSS